jgi:hypothetical protein
VCKQIQQLCFLQYSTHQLATVKKMSAAIQNKECRFEEGVRIKHEQLQQLDNIKNKLQQNLREIDNRTPYIQVKHVVAKIY